MPLKLINSSPASESETDRPLQHHPASLLEAFAQSLGEDACFELSYYKYQPQSLLDERRKIKVKTRDLTLSKVSELLSALRFDEELAFHSSIQTGKRRKFHLPLIDFHGQLNANSLDILEKTIGARLFDSLFLYNSGRSFHGYIMRPLSESQWVRFMGALLLTNLPDRLPITDSRWVGHRLRAGFASLRWSKNTSQYKQLPTHISKEEIRNLTN